VPFVYISISSCIVFAHLGGGGQKVHVFIREMGWTHAPYSFAVGSEFDTEKDRADFYTLKPTARLESDYFSSCFTCCVVDFS
jgi:hypothetical protein